MVFFMLQFKISMSSTIGINNSTLIIIRDNIYPQESNIYLKVVTYNIIISNNYILNIPTYLNLDLRLYKIPVIIYTK